MPKLKNVAKRKPFNTPSFKEGRTPWGEGIGSKIASSEVKSALIAYAVRAVMDSAKRVKLTPMQDRLVSILLSKNLVTPILRRYSELPKTARDAFDGKYFKGAASDVDDHFRKTIKKLIDTISKDIPKKVKAKADLKLTSGFSDLHINNSSLSAMIGAIPPPLPPPQPVYDFSLDYLGISTRKTDDRGVGGVEPYLIQGIYRISDQGNFEEILPPAVIKQHPWNLDNMDADEWMPSGGSQDSNGNPSNPLRMFSGAFPPLGLDRTYYSVIQVWEQDGGQGGKIASAMGGAMLSIAPWVLAAGASGGPLTAPVAIVASAAIVAAGLALELIGWIWSSSASDDKIADLLLCFNPSDICNGSTQYIEQTAAGGGNKWVLYFRASSVKE